MIPRGHFQIMHVSKIVRETEKEGGKEKENLLIVCRVAEVIKAFAF